MEGIYKMTITEKRERVDNLWKWVIALKSGKYKHIKDFLRTSEGYDCFGVACEVFKEEGDEWTLEEGEIDYLFVPNGTKVGLAFGPPRKIMEKLGLSLEDEQFIVEVNDKNDDFIEVAKTIVHFYVKPVEMSIGVFNMQCEAI